MPFNWTVVSRSQPNLAPNITAATAAAYYCDENGAPDLQGQYYGFEGTITLPTADVRYGSLMVVHVMVTDPAPSTRRQELTHVSRSDFFGNSPFSWKTPFYKRPSADEDFQKVEFECENTDGKRTPNPLTLTHGVNGVDLGVTGIALPGGQGSPPSPPLTVTGVDHPAERYLDDVNLTHTFVYPTITPTPWAADVDFVDWWIAEDGVNWGYIGRQLVGQAFKYDILAPHSTTNVAKVRAACGNDYGLSAAVDSDAFQLTGLTAVPASGAGAMVDGSVSYVTGYTLGVKQWFPYGEWTNPTDPNFMHASLWMRRVNQAGAAAPNPTYGVEGSWREVTQGNGLYNYRAGATITWGEANKGWGLPQPNEPLVTGYRYYEFRLYAKTRLQADTPAEVIYLNGADIPGTLCQVWDMGGGPNTATTFTLYVAESEEFDPAMIGVGLEVTQGKIRAKLAAGLTATTDGSIKLATSNLANLVMNPGFEDGVAHWTAVGAVVEAGWSYTGLKRLRMTPGQSVYQIGFTARPGEQYYVEAYLAFDGGSTGSARVAIVFQDANDTGLNGYEVPCPANIGAVWTKFSITATAPTNTSKFYIHILFDVGGPTGTAYLDNVYCAKVTPPAEIDYDNAIFGVSPAGKFTQIAVDFSKPKAGTYDASVFDPSSNNFKLKLAAGQFQTLNSYLEIKAISANIIQTGSLYVTNGVYGGVGNVAGIYVQKETAGVWSQMAWIGFNGGYEGGWFKNFYCGGTSPLDAPFGINASGTVFISTSTVNSTSGSILINKYHAGTNTDNYALISDTQNFDSAGYAGPMGIALVRQAHSGALTYEPYTYYVSRGMVVYAGDGSGNFQIASLVGYPTFNGVRNVFHGEMVLYDGAGTEAIHCNGGTGQIECRSLLVNGSPPGGGELTTYSVNNGGDYSASAWPDGTLMCQVTVAVAGYYMIAYSALATQTGASAGYIILAANTANNSIFSGPTLNFTSQQYVSQVCFFQLAANTVLKLIIGGIAASTHCQYPYLTAVRLKA